MNWIDIISILPFYLDLIALAITGDSSESPFGDLSILRLARSLRLVKLFRYSSGMQMISHCLVQSSDALQLFALIFGLLIVVCASAIYYSERGDYHADEQAYYRLNPRTEVSEINPYESIPASLWWCVVTLTTVGYGDVAPVTSTGQLVGFFTMLLGIICVAMPLSIVGSNFHEIHQGMRNDGEEEEEAVGADRNASDVLYEAAEASEEVENIAECSVVMAEGLSLMLRRYLEPEWWDSFEDSDDDDDKDPVPINSPGGRLSVGRMNGHVEHGELKVDDRHLTMLEEVVSRALVHCHSVRQKLG